MISLTFFFIVFVTPLLYLIAAPLSLFSLSVPKKLSVFLFNANGWLGWWEYLVSPARNTLYGLYALACLSFSLWSIYVHDAELPVREILPYIAILCLCVASKYHHVFIRLKLCEVLKSKPDLDPRDFFDLVHQQMGPWPSKKLDLSLLRSISPRHTSFLKEKRSHQSILFLLPALWDTFFLAHTSLKALGFMTRDFAREVFDVMASMWGKRILQIFHASLSVSGSEKIETLEGKNILIFNHKSQLDFALTFYALSHCKLPSGREIRPRFITAKDHFLENPLIYSIIGVGRLIETVDMVFIDRKKAGKGFQNLLEAAASLASKDIDMAIFPQGTRAEGNIDRSNKRRDAGYYTTVSPKDIDNDLGHLRKGTAYLAVDTLMAMAKLEKHQKLNLVFIGISGTATTMAKQSFKVQTQSEIHYHVGDIVTLDTSQVNGFCKPQSASATSPEEEAYLKFVENLHQEIDTCLARSVGIAQNLIHRFLLDSKGPLRLSTERLTYLEQLLTSLADTNPLPFHILDRIYACPPKDWNAYLSEFTHILLDGHPELRLRQLRSQITVRMLESITSKTHGKKIKKQEIKKEGLPKI